MFERIIQEISVIAAMIVGLAIIATLVSSRARTSQVIESSTSGFASLIRAATGPVSGGGFGGGFSGGL